MRTVFATIAETAAAAATAVVGAPSASAVADTTAPTITGVTVLTSTVAAGDAVALRLSAQDDLSGVASMTAQLSGGGTMVGLLAPGGEATFLSADGLVSGVAPLGAEAGSYSLVSVVVADHAGNSTTYTPGSAISVPAAANPPLDLAATTVTVVQPAKHDVTAPRLTAFSMLTKGDRHPGEFVTFAFATSDDLSPVSDVLVRMCDPLDAQAIGRRGGGRLQSGRLSVWIPPDKAPGHHWHVCGASVTDSSGNVRTYSTYSSFGVDLVAGAVRPDPLVTQDERPDPVVTTAMSAPLVATGSAVSVVGTVRYAGVAVPYPTVAVYAERGGVRSFVGLARGTATGAYARRVVPAGTTVYRTYFLGSDRGGASSPAGLGRGARVSTGVRQALAVATTGVRVPLRTTGVLAVTLLPRRSAVVRLQRWTGRTWVAVATVRTRSTGTTALRVARPASVAAYRWTVAYDGVGLTAVSRIVTVRAV